jgi:hypothetical protein
VTEGFQTSGKLERKGFHLRGEKKERMHKRLYTLKGKLDRKASHIKGKTQQKGVA